MNRTNAALGLAAVAAFGAHAAFTLVRGVPWEVLWSCHLATLAVGIGLAFGLPLVNAIGLLWLSIGIPLWILYMVGGGVCHPTSVVSHFGGAVLGSAGVKRLGMPRNAWWKAVAALAALQLASRFFTPPEENINLSHAVWRGWEDVFPSYPVYWVLLTLVSCAAFFAAEWAARRVRTA